MLRLVTHNWELKLVAGAVAGTLWFFVATSEHSQVALAAPVEYVGLRPDLVIVSGQRDTAEVEVRAIRSVVARLGPETLRVRVDLAGIHEGESVVQLSPPEVRAPAGATVTRITPAQLHLTVAAAAAGTATVVPQVHGMPAPGFAVRRVAVEPSTVSIKGPRSTIESRGEVLTLPVDVAGSRRSVSQSVGLLLPASTYVTSGRTVRVTVEIAEDGMSQHPQSSRDVRKKAAGR